MGLSPQVLSASDVLGNKVKNVKGESLGTVQELIIDPDSGRIVGALLSHEDATKLGEHLAAVPWNALTLSKEDGAIYADSEMMEHPLRRQRDWPEMPEPPQWSKNIVVYTSSVYKGNGDIG